MDSRIIPNISVDCVIFGLNNNGLNVLLMERILNQGNEIEPLVNDYVLTGYHVFKNETLDDSASRVLMELTGLKGIYKKQFKAFGDPDRLMNEKDLIWARNQEFNSRTITIAYYFLLITNQINPENNNKHNAQWFPLDNLPELGFDHKRIIDEAYEDLKIKVLNEPIVFELLPKKFTLNELQKAYESILDIKIDNRNFRKKANMKKYIVQLDEKKVGNSKKPANLYMFSKDVYEMIHKKSSLINL